MENKIERLSIFDGLPETAYEEILSLSRPGKLTADEVLFEVGETGEEMYIIVEGLLKISVDDPASERQKTIAMLGEGEIVGEMASFGEQERSARATAIKETELLGLKKEDFIELFQQYPRIGLNLVNALSERLLATDKEIHSLTFQNVPGRLAACLLRLAEKFGTTLESGRKIDIELTHKRLAELVGTNRETVSRYMKKFKQAGGVVSESKKIVITDQDKLENWM